MTDAADLERRYRRLLRCFPTRYRREHEQEILSVLMAGAAEGQRRPGLADSADLVMSAIFIWWREVTRQPRWRWEHRHPRLLIRLFWLCQISIIFSSLESSIVLSCL